MKFDEEIEKMIEEDQEFDPGSEDENTERQARLAMRFEEGEPYFKPLDDLTERRTIDAMLDAADEPVKQTTGHTRKLLIGVAAALLLGFGATLFIVNLPKQDPNAPVTTAKNHISSKTTTSPSVVPAPASSKKVEGRVVMISGTLSGSSQMNKTIRSGDVIEVEHGQMVLTIPPRVALLLEPDTSVKMNHLGNDLIEVGLEHGTLFASIDPDKAGPGFAVATSKGKAVVTGTVFSLQADDDDVTLKVFRGSVRTEDGGAINRTVRAPQSTVLGSSEIKQITTAESDIAWNRARSLSLLADASGTMVDIRSRPSGAMVTIDGVVLGQTPLLAIAQSGHREMELTQNGYAPIHERLELGFDSVNRDFEMRELDLLAKTMPGAAKAPKRKAVATPVASARQMLAQAQYFRAQRDWKSAANAYQNLIKHHFGSAEARTARVSLGDIQRTHLGQPARSIKNYNAYLSKAPRGTLSTQAAFGRAKAFRAMGQIEKEKKALTEFLARYPSALQAPEARNRLYSLGSN